MSDVIQIKRLILSQFRQFEFCDLSFTHPTTGEPLSEICLLGASGSGKSTILSQIYHTIDPTTYPASTAAGSDEDSLVLTQLSIGEQSVYLARPADGKASKPVWFSDDIEQTKRWNKLSEKPLGFKKFARQFSDFKLTRKEIPKPAETALAFFSPQLAYIDSEPAEDFYQFIYNQRRQRQDRYHRFLLEESNRDRTVAEVEADFQANSPDPLQAVKGLWNNILKDLSISFHPNQEPPLINSRTDKEISFYSLSPGLQSYLLRIALVYCQYFDQPEKQGFVFLDEPETGLSPELSVSLVQFFQPNQHERAGQLFVATHQSEVAVQFEPENLINLVIDEETGNVEHVPIEFEAEEEEEESDEPEKSPEAESVPLPLKKTAAIRYSKLKREIQDTDDQDKLADLIDEAVSIRKL